VLDTGQAHLACKKSDKIITQVFLETDVISMEMDLIKMNSSSFQHSQSNIITAAQYLFYHSFIINIILLRSPDPARAECQITIILCTFLFLYF